MVGTSPPIFRAPTAYQPSPPPRKARQSHPDSSAVGLVNSVLTAVLPMVKVGCGRLITKFNDLGGLPLAGPLSSYSLRVQNNYDRGAGKQKVAEDVDPDSLVTELALQLLLRLLRVVPRDEAERRVAHPHGGVAADVREGRRQGGAARVRLVGVALRGGVRDGLALTPQVSTLRILVSLDRLAVDYAPKS